MRTRTLTLVAALIVAGLQATIAQQVSSQAEKLLAAAQHKAIVEGDLQSAIEQYRAIIDTFQDDDAVVADALLRLADCYEKLSDARAQSVYERIVRDHGDLRSVAAIARARLRIIAAPASSKLASEPVAVQLWEGSGIESNAALSPDGRYLAFSSWAENGNLVVKDVATGIIRRITHDAEGRTGGPSPLWLTFSPDGTRIAYSWWTPNENSLRIVNRDGSGLRIVSKSTEIDMALAWSPDGRSIAINLYQQGQSRLAVASVRDGSIVPLKATGWRKAIVGGFSGDGRFLVYSLSAAASQTDSGVFILAVDGSSETKLAEGTSPAWTPDGRAIVFVSDRLGSSDLWITPIADGKPTGAPELLRKNVSANSGITRDGSLFYEVRTPGRDVLLTRVDPISAHVEQPVRLTDVSVGSNGGASWSHDGQHIAFVRGSGSQAKKLVIRRVATAEERVVPMSFTNGLPAQNSRGRWFPDDRSLLLIDRMNGREVFTKVDVQTGLAQTVVETRMLGTAQTGTWDLSPDGRFFVFVRRGEPNAADVRTYSVIRREIATGDETELHRVKRGGLPGYRGLAISPAGTHVAIKDQVAGALLLLPMSGGASIALETRRDALEPLAWTKDGQYILGVNGGGEERDHLWAAPAAGGPRVPLDLSAENINTISVSPADGRLALSVTRPHFELWLLKNILKADAVR
jgi:Tol biopolymer transport system component